MTNAEAMVRALSSGIETVPELVQTCCLSPNTVRFYLSRLRGAVSSERASYHHKTRYRLIVPEAKALAMLQPPKSDGSELCRAWPMPVLFPPVVCHEPRRHVVTA